MSDPMSPAARSLFVFAIYLAVLAVLLLVVPNMMLTVFGFPPTTEVWIRVVGMLVGVLALYDYVAAVSEARGLMWASVLARLTVPFFFLIFVVAGWVHWPILLFGLVDIGFALWTWRELTRARKAG
jgi:hypothetical protein